MVDRRNGNVGLKSLPNLLHIRNSSRPCPIKPWAALFVLRSPTAISLISLPLISLPSCNLLTNKALCHPSLTHCRRRTGNRYLTSGLPVHSLLIPPGRGHWISLPLTSPTEKSANPNPPLPSIHSLPTPVPTRMSLAQWVFQLTLVAGVLAP